MKNHPAQKSSSHNSRRRFLGQVAAAAAGVLAVPSIVPSSVLGADGKVAPSNRILLAIIGTGNQGFNDMQSVPRRRAGADRGRLRRQPRKRRLLGRQGRRPRAGRRLVEEHYAAQNRRRHLPGLRGLRRFSRGARPEGHRRRRGLHAGPLARDPGHRRLQGRQGHLLPEAAVADDRRGPRDELRGQAIPSVVFQTGSQQRSDVDFRRACELVRNGRIGKLHTVRVGLPAAGPTTPRPATARSPRRCPRASSTTSGSAPRPKPPYAPARCHVNFRWIYDYSGGQVTDWGGHHPDCAQWGMGTELTGPIEIATPRASSRPTSSGTRRPSILLRGDLRERREDDRLQQGEEAA